MSLLLKALKQAEAANADKADLGSRGDGGLELEPPAPTGPVQGREWVEPPGLLFGSSGLTPEPQRARGFRWPRLSPVPLAAALAALIAIGYGIYLYFALQPPAPLAPPATASAAPAEAVAPAPPVPGGEATPSSVPSPSPVPSSAPAPAVATPASGPALPAAARRAAPPAEAAASATPAAPAALPQFRPDPQTMLLGQAYAAYQRGALDEAQHLYGQAAARGGSVDALLGLAAIASVQDRDADAQRLYREVLALDPHNATAQAALLDLLGHADPGATESRLKTLIEREPGPHLYQTLGNLYADQGRWSEAQAAYFEAYRRAPDNADYAFNLAVSLDQLRQYPAALSYYEKALAGGGAHRFDRARAEARVQQLGATR